MHSVKASNHQLFYQQLISQAQFHCDFSHFADSLANLQLNENDKQLNAEFSACYQLTWPRVEKIKKPFTMKSFGIEGANGKWDGENTLAESNSALKGIMWNVILPSFSDSKCPEWSFNVLFCIFPAEAGRNRNRGFMQNQFR